jgi:alkanesulfonate monooxygenase SsuD/methylene tetrahydromethanopterin reductase-like flavin-dependent oxidoreductase (luciferase family)
VVKRLWSEPVIEHHGEFYDFGPVAFEPKPVQKPWPRLHVGGESDAALARAARHGDGWLGLGHTHASLSPLLARLRELRVREEREHEPFEITIGAALAAKDDVARFAALGVHRLMLTPWERSREAVDGLRRTAELLDLS